MHKPVLLEKVLEIFNPRRGQIYIDATIDGGGHARAILEKIGAEGKLLGIDWDRELLGRLKVENPKLKVKNLILVCDNYAHIKSIAGKYNLGKVDGILFDLGFSLYHLEESRRGFSFLKNEPLDMRYNPDFNELTAEKIVNKWPPEAIENILREYGGERFSRRIARGIVGARRYKKISATAELVRIISRSVPGFYLKRRVHPATKTFQALRIAVNRELENLRKALYDSADILKPGGKIIVISFHSLEDRIVKNFFRKNKNAFTVFTPKPVCPAKEEIKSNPRARSAKLRAGTKSG